MGEGRGPGGPRSPQLASRSARPLRLYGDFNTTDRCSRLHQGPCLPSVSRPTGRPLLPRQSQGPASLEPKASELRSDRPKRARDYLNRRAALSLLPCSGPHPVAREHPRSSRPETLAAGQPSRPVSSLPRGVRRRPRVDGLPWASEHGPLGPGGRQPGPDPRGDQVTPDLGQDRGDVERQSALHGAEGDGRIFNDAESTPRLTNLSTLTTVRRRAAEAVGAPDCHRWKATAAVRRPSVRPGLGGGLAPRSFVPRRCGRPATRAPPRIGPGPLAGSWCPADRSRRDSRSHRPPQGGPWMGRPLSRLLHNVLDHAHGVGARAVALKERPPVRPLRSSSAVSAGSMGCLQSARLFSLNGASPSGSGPTRWFKAGGPILGDRYDLWHAVRASVADVFVTLDQRLADHAACVPVEGFRVVTSLRDLVDLLEAHGLGGIPGTARRPATMLLQTSPYQEILGPP